MLKQIVSSKLRERFPAMDIEFAKQDTNLIAKISPIHSSWKPIMIRDDGSEVTVFFGDLTHSHYKYYGDDAPASTKALAIAEEVVEELSLVFDDQLEFWKTRSSSGMGPLGSRRRHSENSFGPTSILWSGRNGS